MGTKTQTIRFDDLDGQSPADDTVEFRGPDGKLRVIDLTDEHAKQLTETLERFAEDIADFVNAARLVDVKPAAAGRRKAARGGTAKRTGSSVRPVVDKAQNEAIREWAQRNGYPVAARGRISAEIQQAFHENRPAESAVVEGAPAASSRRRRG